MGASMTTNKNTTNNMVAPEIAVLPWDLTIEILLLLPLDSLIWLKLVSKSFYKLINDPDFAKLYHRCATGSHPKSIIIHYAETRYRRLGLPELDNAVELNTLGRIMDSNGIQCGRCLDFTRFNVGTGWYYPVMIGSSNGLIAVFQAQLIVVSNPATQTHWIVPWPIWPSRWNLDYYRLNLGFGYDLLRYDYKIIFIMSKYIGVWNVRSVTDVKVYSLNSDSWRSCPLPKISSIKVPFNQSPPVFVHGSFHWLGERSDRTTTIISFDIHDETYGEDLCLPNEHDHTCMEILAFCSLDDCLCLVTGQDRYWDANEIWVMREYAIRESWSKIYTIKDVLLPVYLSEPISKNTRGHEIIYINKFNSLIWYDSRHESKRRVFHKLLNATLVKSIPIILRMKGRSERRTKCLHQDSKKQFLFKRLVRCNQY